MHDREILRTEQVGGDLRFVILTSCQSGCDFCHLEAHKVGEEIGTLNPALAAWKERRAIDPREKYDSLATPQDVDRAIQIAKRIGFRKIHLTGGEPTLHPFILNIIRQIRESNLEVGMTSHGEYNDGMIQKYLEAGLNSLNISMHAITPEQYLAMDLVAKQNVKIYGHEKGLRYAKARIEAKLQTIATADRLGTDGNYEHFHGVKVNSVVLDPITTKQIIAFTNAIHIPCRLQRDLNNPKISEAIIQQVITELNAELVHIDVAVGDSSGSGETYIYGKGGTFKVKSFGDVYVEQMCGDCTLINTQQCRERFYGLRYEAKPDGDGLVRTCIDRTKQDVTVFKGSTFIQEVDREGSVPHAIKKSYDAHIHM